MQKMPHVSSMLYCASRQCNFDIEGASGIFASILDSYCIFCCISSIYEFYVLFVESAV